MTFCGVWCSSALADEYADKKVAESALAEARTILSRELWGHYDVAELAVERIEDLRNRMSALGHDYGLLKVRLTFSAKRNTTRHPNLNREIFERGNAMCQGWLYLHCGVPFGHLFDGTIEILLAAADRDGSWRAVSPHWRSRRQKEGYVLFPKPRER